MCSDTSAADTQEYSLFGALREFLLYILLRVPGVCKASETKQRAYACFKPKSTKTSSGFGKTARNNGFFLFSLISDEYF